MKQQIRSVYICEFCKKAYFSKFHARRHEERCYKNPVNNRPCFHCLFLDKQDVEIEGYHTNRTVSLFFCKKRAINLYPPICELKGNAFDTGEENKPMPTDCQYSNELTQEVSVIIDELLTPISPFQVS